MSSSPDALSPQAERNDRRVLRAVIKGSILFLSLAGIILLAHLLRLEEIVNTEWADIHLRAQGCHGVLLYMTLVAVLSAVGIPRQALSALGGYAFGALYGTGLACMGLAAGCACGFFYARLLARASLQKRFGKRIQRLDAFLSHRPFLMSIAIRLMPMGNNALTNMAAGITSASPKSFIAGSCIGYLPQTIIFALLGSGIRLNPEIRVTVSALLFVLSSLLGYLLYRKFREEQARSCRSVSDC